MKKQKKINKLAASDVADWNAFEIRNDKPYFNVSLIGEEDQGGVWKTTDDFGQGTLNT